MITDSWIAVTQDGSGREEREGVATEDKAESDVSVLSAIRQKMGILSLTWADFLT